MEEIVSSERYCGRCKEWKASTEFSPRNAWCKKCRRQYNNSRHDSTKRRAENLKRHYQLSLEEYNSLLEKQGGVCACCKLSETRMNKRIKGLLHVDHCHKTGKVRGLLCTNCNTALGLLKEDPERVQALLLYVQTIV
jgi:Recombination endonuclease VII